MHNAPAMQLLRAACGIAHVAVILGFHLLPLLQTPTFALPTMDTERNSKAERAGAEPAMKAGGMRMGRKADHPHVAMDTARLPYVV